MKKVAKIGLDTLGFKAKEIRKLVEDSGEMVFLARIGGVVCESFGGVSKHGEWTGFKGIFSAINKDGEALRSTVCFLPTNITKKLVEKLEQGMVDLEFAVDVYANETDKNASGYAYICEPVFSDESEKKAETISQRLLSKALPTSTQKALPTPESAKNGKKTSKNTV